MSKKIKNSLPSGSVRVQRRYTGTDGKTHTKSFTGPTKAEAEARAAEWEHQRGRITEHITVADAVKRYIDLKEPVLSPSSIRGYRVHQRQHLRELGGRDLLSIQNADVQLWVSDLAAAGLSPKTISNAYGLVTSAIAMFMPDLPIRCTLPARRRPELYCPSAEEVQAVIDATEDPETRVIILLAAVGTMRRGEILALRWCDIQGNVIKIRRSAVVDDAGEWSVKDPKTRDSRRDVLMPGWLIDALKALRSDLSDEDGEIFSINAATLRNRFKRAIRAAGVHDFRFHDLRHFSASQMHAMGVPDKYIEARGGWRPGSTVMKTVYQDVIDLERARQEKQIADAFTAKLGV